MKHVPQDKYNVAWFTLAECVSRGEKVRALGVYRLLAHSIDDVAFARQLEGDILLALQDKDEAINKYKDAAFMYQQHGKLLEAIAIFEHLRCLEPDKLDHIKVIADLYQKINMKEKAIQNLKVLFEGLLRKNDIAESLRILTVLDSLLRSGQAAHEHQQMVFALMRDGAHEQEQVIEHIKIAVKGFLQSDDNRALQKFLATLEALNPSYAADAHNYVLEYDSKAE
jgi:tetratricopeptide (TPR) repeat protein